MRHNWLVALGMFAATAALAQDGKRPPPRNDKTVGAIPSEQQAFEATLNQPPAPKTYSWKVGDPTILMQQTASHICMLTGVGGNFSGAGERVVLGIDKGAAGGPRWTLS